MMQVSPSLLTSLLTRPSRSCWEIADKQIRLYTREIQRWAAGEIVIDPFVCAERIDYWLEYRLKWGPNGRVFV